MGPAVGLQGSTRTAQAGITTAAGLNPLQIRDLGLFLGFSSRSPPLTAAPTLTLTQRHRPPPPRFSLPLSRSRSPHLAQAGRAAAAHHQSPPVKSARWARPRRRLLVGPWLTKTRLAPQKLAPATVPIRHVTLISSISSFDSLLHKRPSLSSPCPCLAATSRHRRHPPLHPASWPAFCLFLATVTSPSYRPRAKFPPLPPTLPLLRHSSLHLSARRPMPPFRRRPNLVLASNLNSLTCSSFPSPTPRPSARPRASTARPFRSMGDA